MEQLGSTRLLHYDFEHPHTLYAATERLFGEQRLPYYDIANASYLLSFGADYLGNWLSPVHFGLGYGHSRQDRDAGRGRFVQIEPRMSLSGAAADEWIAARPGTEGILALGIAHQIVANSYDGDDRANWAQVLERYTPGFVGDATGVPADTVVRLAAEFADADAGLAIGGDATGNHTNGVDALIAVNTLNYLAGNIGRVGGVVFNPDSVFDTVPNAHRAGYRQLAEFADDARAGKIDILIVNNTNPVFTLPAASGFAEALENIPLIVSLSSFIDETTAHADLILPSHTYLESWGDHAPDPGVGFPVAAISQPVSAPLYNTRATGDIVLDISRRLGFAETMPWSDMETYLKDGWRRIYDRGTKDGETESFDTFWRSILQAGVWGENSKREQQSFAPAGTVIDKIGVALPEFAGDEDEFPFVLFPYVSNSLRDGRGANLPWLQELPDPLTSVVYGSWVEVNPQTAKRLKVREGDVVTVESPHGRLTAPVFVYQAIRPDVIAMPIGQGHTAYGRYAQNRGANPISILAPQEETVTGSLACHSTRIRLIPTGRRVKLVKTGGESRELGRNIVQTTADAGHDTNTSHRTNLNNIPITVESS
jgi:anaerobic selenocysteine-containing dehydrogenase